jgi:hypothetical protein
MNIDDRVIALGTPRQQEIARAINECGGIRAAARKLGIDVAAVSRSKDVLLKRASLHGVAPAHDLTHETAPGMHLRGVSTLYKGDGEIAAQWVKQDTDKKLALETLKAAVEELVADPKLRLPPTRAPKYCDEDTMAVYSIPDAHIGMLAWDKETGQDFDLSIAEKLYADTIDALVASAPPSKQALLIELGDFFHADNSRNMTERSGNILDVDSRYGKVTARGIRILRRAISRLLEKHAKVKVLVKAGNHDENTAIMLAHVIRAVYERDPRVEVSDDVARIERVRWGKCLIGATHGHTIKTGPLPLLMAATWPEDWGATQHRIWYVGHVHHDSLTEAPGCLVETLRTASPRDAYAAGAGYHSGNDLKCDVWHREHGRVARHIQRTLFPRPKGS